MAELKTITRAEWIAALRGGEYKQGKESLKKGRAFCCLGVACDLAGIDWRKLTANSRKVAEFDLVDASTLNRMLGVNDSDTRHLATMNDNGRTFSEIADHIEAMP